MDIEKEREEFEDWISWPPYELSVSRFPNDDIRCMWPGAYKDVMVDLAWKAWQARAKQTITLPVKDATGEH